MHFTTRGRGLDIAQSALKHARVPVGCEQFGSLFILIEFYKGDYAPEDLPLVQGTPVWTAFFFLHQGPWTRREVTTLNMHMFLKIRVLQKGGALKYGKLENEMASLRRSNIALNEMEKARKTPLRKAKGQGLWISASFCQVGDWQPLKCHGPARVGCGTWTGGRRWTASPSGTSASLPSSLLTSPALQCTRTRPMAENGRLSNNTPVNGPF
jgi:hypothetical protein